MQKTPGKSPVARERYWTKIIAEARRYPKGVTEYCRLMNVSKNNYYFWFKRLRPKHPEWHDLTNRPEIPSGEIPDKPSGDRSVPKTEVSLRPQRRKWSGPEKERILEATDNLSGGDLGAVLRREGVYVHTLSKWRTARDLMNIASSKRNGGAPNPLSTENKKLREEIARLGKKLHQANEIILLQKKISEMLTMTLDPIEEA
jgi:transposase